MNVREATADDREAIRRVAERSWEHDYPGILNRETISEGIGEWYSDERLGEVLDTDGALLLVAEDDSEVLGFSHAVWEGTEGSILRLYVEPDSRRTGVGTQLVERSRVALFGEGVDRIRAMVLAENELGNSFYHDHGFERIEVNETTISGESYDESVYVTTRG